MTAPLKSLAQMGVNPEATAGTFVAPVAADANSKIIKSPDIAYDGARVERNIASGTSGTFASDTGARSGVFSSVVEFEGSGTVDTLPAWSAYLRSCGFTETVDAGVDVQWAPTLVNNQSTATAGYPTVSMAYHEGPVGATGHIYNLAGAVGALVMNFTNGETAKMNFTHTGKYQAKVDGALLSGVSYQTENAPVVIGITLTVDGVAWTPNLSELTLDMGTTVELDESSADPTGYNCAVITDFKPSGVMTVAADLEATYALFANSVSNSHSAILQVIIGTAGGNRITVDCPVIQFSLPSLTARGTRAGFTVPFMIHRSTAGDDWINITHD